MIDEIKNISSTKNDLRKFGLTVGSFLIIVGGLFFWFDKASYPYLLALGIVLILCGSALPILLKPVYVVWMTFATILGWVMTRVILSIVFFLVITPIGLIGRLFRYKFLELKWDSAKETYWNYRELTKADNAEYERQF
jgi:hypothetical protein